MAKSKKLTNAAVNEINALANELSTTDLDTLIAGVDTSVLLAQIEDATAEIEITEEERVNADAELDQVIATLDAKDAAHQAQSGDALDIVDPSDVVQAPEAIAEEVQDLPAFADVLEAIEMPERVQMRDCIVRSLDAREDYERNEKANDNILKSLRKSREKLANERIAAVFLATSVDPFEFNRHRVSSNRYNVYAIDKVRDLMEALSSGDMMNNAINRAITRSLFQFRAAGEKFTGDMARAAASDKIRVNASISKILVRHTVSASTAPTQASSTMQALETLGIVKNTGTQKSAVYVLTNTPQTQRLAEIVAKAA